MAESDIEKKLGAAVKKWREKLQLSQDDLAKRAGMHRTYISDVERGSRNVSLKNVEKLADGLTISLATLFASMSTKPATAPMTMDQQVDILMVEDNPEDVNLTMHAFKSGGISNRLYVVRDGAAALDFLFATGAFAYRNPVDLPQVILLDLHLPKIDGLEVLRRLRADARTSSLPIIVLTSSKASEDIAECRRLGVENYIVKPVDLQSFSDVSLRLNLQWVLSKKVSAPVL